MELFDVYPKLPITPVSANGACLKDEKGDEYLDFYGGHAVISIGHHHPVMIGRLEEQLKKIAYYSNAVHITAQQELATKLGQACDLDDYRVFLCNSGAEANENAVKLASFRNNRRNMVVARRGFHGRTGGLVAMTHNRKIVSPLNETTNLRFVGLNDIGQLKEAIDEDTCAFIVEGIQGVAGIFETEKDYLVEARRLCDHYGAFLILDEVQSGYGRTGDFFAYQIADIRPDLVTVAKGMGNGFPIGGVLISPGFRAESGLLGTTFGGNHLACEAGIAVLEVIQSEELIHNTRIQGGQLIEEIQKMPHVKEVRGRGLMIGIEFEFPVKLLRRMMLEQKVITGSAAEPHTMRLLPPLCIGVRETGLFLEVLNKCLKEL